MKVDIRITLLGKFSARRGGETTLHLGRKVQELVAYVLLHPGRQHRRDAVASLLWPGSDREQALKNLRQALWLLHHEFPSNLDALLIQQPDWVGAGSLRGIHVDTLVFEEAYRKSLSGPVQSEEPLASAVKLYRGSLLEGWHDPWCAHERERFREMYLAMLGKLMHYHEKRKEYDFGIEYGLLALHEDPAKEVVHRTLMRLKYLAGDRTGALRQYERCREALRKELDVEPAQETSELLDRIRSDSLDAAGASPRGPVRACPPPPLSVRVLSAPPRNPGA